MPASVNVYGVGSGPGFARANVNVYVTNPGPGPEFYPGTILHRFYIETLDFRGHVCYTIYAR